MSALVRLIDEYRQVFAILPAADAVDYVWHTLVAAPKIFVSGKLYAADCAMRRKLRVRRYGREIVIDCAMLDAESTDANPSFAAVREMYGRNVYLHPFDMTRISGGTFIDAGGAVGLFTVMAAKHADRVIYIEAQDFNLRRLKALIALNAPLAPIEIETVLLSPGPGAALSQAYRERFPELVAMSHKTIAAVLAAHHVDRVAFLKCDIEGAEFPIFDDAESWLGSVDNLAMEVHRDMGNPLRLETVLRVRGYSVLTKNAQLKRVAAADADYLYASRTGALVGAH